MLLKEYILDLSERISQLVPSYRVEERYSQNTMGEEMAYEISIENQQGPVAGVVNLTMGGVELKLAPELEELSTALESEFSTQIVREKYGAYQKEYDNIQGQWSKRWQQLPPLKEIPKLDPYAERLGVGYAYLVYTEIRDRSIDEYVRRGLSADDLREVKTILEEFINESDPEIFNL